MNATTETIAIAHTVGRLEAARLCRHAPGLDVHDIEDYLTATGWARRHTFPLGEALWARSGGEAIVVATTDHCDTVPEAVHQLTRCEHRTARAIVRDIVTTTSSRETP